MKLSLMFLGGLPHVTSDSGKCWEQLMKRSDSSVFKDFVFVVHPIKPIDTLVGFWKDYLYTGKKETGKIKCIMVTQPKKHLKTKWATRSLVDVTITMIKESYNFANTIQKFVLLDSSTCPLYNLQVIRDTLIDTRKSWLDPLNNSCKNVLREHPNLYCDKTTCLKKKDCSFWSQWFIIDSRHIRPLLLTKIKKSTKEAECGGRAINQIKVTNKTKNLNARIVDSSLIEMLDNNQKPCTFADELYFGLFLKRNKTIKEFKNLIKTKSDFQNSYDEIKPLNVSDLVVGVDPSVNVNANTTSSQYAKFVLPENMEHDEVVAYADMIRDDITEHKYPFYLPSVKFNDRDTKTKTVASTYTDWRYFNLNPDNIFRSLEYEKYLAKDLLNVSISDSLKIIRDIAKSNGQQITFETLKMSHVPYWAHPMEYNSVTLQKFVNGYNLLELFGNLSNDDYQLQYIKSLYLQNIFDDIRPSDITWKRQTISKTRYKFITSIKHKTQLHGSRVTHDVLNSARMRGSLFIRKCGNGSFIHKFAKQLFDPSSKYIYE